MRKSLIGSAGILLDIVVFYLGFFFLYWGTWNYLSGSAVPGMGFGIFMIVAGAALVGLGVLGALRLYSFFRRHRLRITIPNLYSLLGVREKYGFC